MYYIFLNCLDLYNVYYSNNKKSHRSFVVTVVMAIYWLVEKHECDIYIFFFIIEYVYRNSSLKTRKKKKKKKRYISKYVVHFKHYKTCSRVVNALIEINLISL